MLMMRRRNGLTDEEEREGERQRRDILSQDFP
jgi:hypothetical protein